MKKLITVLFTGIILSGCTDKKAQEKAILDDLMKVHEKVMGSDEQLMKNKILLDSMIKHNSTADIKDSVNVYISKVNLADSAMSDWMHKFDYERKGKSPDENVVYFNDQKKLILAIDSQINSTVASSNKYLTKMKMK